jgi:hypothetical protein
MIPENQMIKIQENSLVKAQNLISITNKLIYNGFDKIFNQAFYLLNSEIDLDKNINYCICFDLDAEYYRRDEFDYKAKDDKDYQNAIDLFTEVLNKNPKHKFSYLLRNCQ